MLLCLLGMIVLHRIFPLRMISSWVILGFGIALMIIGLGIAFEAEGQFRRSGTTVDHLGMPAKLVTNGWFKYSRNPMYLSFALILIGVWLSLGSVSSLLGLLLYLFLTQQWYIRPEEKRLVEKFGRAYESYIKKTRRWL
jgi:protein-S-isoprenylcysteine O-methyltransferase Ste14